MNGMEYIRKTYGVPAKRGMRVRWLAEHEGKIIGTHSAHLRVKLDDDWLIKTLHPTWEMEYQTEDGWYKPKLKMEHYSR